ncbi:phenylalanine--tRNA ligase subunit beta [Candidatus Saccharibacteria bacterium]|nr:phenylalanine--tRNA ligase subunit beta [Candidatus Saccharibacteria bacterium]
MRISLNEIKKLVPAATKVETSELIKLIGARLVEVEGSFDWGEKYKNIFVVKVLSAEAIPETHLHLCQIDAGSEPVQVVCGAPNVHEGMLAAWIKPGAIVPATYGTAEPFEIGARKLRGYGSNGMLAAADELDLGDDHAGIIEINPEMVTDDGRQVAPGMTLAEVFGLNDIILDIENKSLTHRPDCFGLIGFAREVAGILGEKFEEPTIFEMLKRAENGDTDSGVLAETGTLDIQITDQTLCPRYSAAVFEFNDVPKSSKYFTKTAVFLAKAGMRAISPIVDLTNVLMLETGQPLHAFDYDKFKIVGGGEARIIVRTARKGEELTLLDSKVVKLNENDILITSNDRPVALAGAMGGANTEIDDTTKKIILESATFSLYNLRKTQMAHGIFSEAITRFTKGQPASLTLPVLTEAAKRLSLTPVEVADCRPTAKAMAPINLTTAQVNNILGTQYSIDEMTRTLENVGFTVKTDGDNLSVSVPAWRTDVHIPEDVVEEIGRLLGYDNIPLQLPMRPFTGAKQDNLLTLKNNLRDVLSDRLNMNEVLTYSFVSSKLQETVGEDPKDSYAIVNSISPELQRFRQTIAPSLLEKMHDNLKAGFSGFALYEINQVTRHSLGLNTENVPEMKTHLAVAMVGDFYDAKNIFNNMMMELGLAKPEYHTVEEAPAYYEKSHSAIAKAGDVTLGVVGEVKGRVLRALKIKVPVTIFEIDLEELLKAPVKAVISLKLSKFPTVSRDLTVQVKAEQEFSAIQETIENGLIELIATVEPVSIYQKESETKNLSFHLSFSHPEKTLNSEEISDIMVKIERELIEKFDARVI